MGPMRKVLAVVVVVLMLFLVACAARATKVFVVEVSPYSMEYTPGQIHDYLRNRGFQRVKFRDADSGIIVYERRTADVDEQHFRLKSYPQIEVVVRLEKIRHTFVKSEPRVIVYFNEDGRSSMSNAAAQEYDRLFEEVVARVGVDRVEVW
ncbi:MAG: hypothetical protein QNL90_15615 [Gammaproteobacteria bacterium]|nr:hypothetical protein [Gammaproteobacteria bacterium]MDX2461574.1 hypothetical protein [Gammaproteobacteria bacterium]